MDDSSEKPRISKRKMYGNGTILALFISVPAIVAYVITYTLTESFIISLTTSVVTFFILTGLSVKLSKKFLRV